MLICSARYFIFLSITLFTLNTSAEEINFGKETPSEEQIIEYFKPPSTEQTVEEKTRGLVFVKKDSSTHKQNLIKQVKSEKAISLEILFDYNSWFLSDEAKEQLRPFGNALATKDLAGLQYRIEGHTDIVGGDKFNIELSKRRAEAVKTFLVNQYGLSSSSLIAYGKGKAGLADNSDPTNQANRRVRVVRLND